MTITRTHRPMDGESPAAPANALASWSAPPSARQRRIAAARRLRPKERKRETPAGLAAFEEAPVLPRARRERARRAVAAQRAGRALDRRQVDVGVAEEEPLADQHRLRPPARGSRSGVTTGSRVRITRNGPKARTSNADSGRGDRSGICSERDVCSSSCWRRGPRRRGRAAARASSRLCRARSASARGSDDEREVAVALPGLRGRAGRSRAGRRSGGSSRRGTRPRPRAPRCAPSGSQLKSSGVLVARPARPARRRAQRALPVPQTAARAARCPAADRRARRTEAGRSGGASPASRCCARSRGAASGTTRRARGQQPRLARGARPARPLPPRARPAGPGSRR